MQPALAQENAFTPGWTMDPATSTLRFQSIKKGTVVETSSFATYTGTIDETGLATVRVLMDSVNTNIDLRNVRMRFLLFETFQYPEAMITMQIDPAMIADLVEVRRKTVLAPYTIELHGVRSQDEAEITITLLDDNRVAVSSATPIVLTTADFALDGGVAKLEEAAKVDILPLAPVTFDFLFERAESADEFAEVARALSVDAGLNAAAMEEEGDFTVEACADRFATMSQSNSINFGIGSARLTEDSNAVLDSILDVFNRCPDLAIEVGGHTDTDGSRPDNQALSEARAQAVRSYLVDAGVDAERITAVGFGEIQPLVPNSTAANKQRNRRIEFKIIEE